MNINRRNALGMVIGSGVLYYILEGNTVGCLILSITWLTYALVCTKCNIMQKYCLLENRVTNFISNISMEIYFSCCRKVKIESYCQ